MTPVVTQKSTGKLTFLSHSGDDQLVWDRDDVKQVSDAEKQFNKWKDKGYSLFRVGKKGKQTPITKFDPDAEEILCVQTTKKG